MTTLSKTLLAVSVAGFAAGSIIDFGGFSVNPSFTVALPVGAVFFGLFLISFMLEKEMAKYNKEERGKLQLNEHKTVGSAAAQKAKVLSHADFVQQLPIEVGRLSATSGKAGGLR
jgi:hypothetical protein